MISPEYLNINQPQQKKNDSVHKFKQPTVLLPVLVQFQTQTWFCGSLNQLSLDKTSHNKRLFENVIKSL